MGQVYRAEDLDLGRQAALKVSTGTSTRAQQDKIELEARVLAKLSHPNVVTVYGVGSHGARMFIAMEYADGGTSRQWLREPRPSHAVLDHFVAAGRGLQAAHLVDVVHGDFKPDNILLAEHGRVLVADFGLAQLPALQRTHDDFDSEHGSQTAAGGTLAYASPERRRGEEATVQSDLFALCVCMHEGLTGRRPEIDEQSTAVEVSSRPGGVSRRVWAAIVRGLHPSLNTRWTDVGDLLDEITKARRRRPWPLLAGSVVVAGSIGLWGGQPPSCEVPDALVDELWNPQLAEKLAQAHAALDAPMAATSAASVNAALEDYAQRWRQARQTVCRATHVEHTQSDAQLDARMRCLDQGKRTAERLVSMLTVSDASVVSRSLSATSNLPSPAQCVINPDRPAMPSDETAAAAIEGVQADLAEGRALILLGHFADVVDLLEPHLPSQAVADHSPTAIDLDIVYGQALAGLGRHDDAAPRVHRALGRALEAGLLSQAAWAAGSMTRLVAAQRSTAAQVDAWADVATGLLRRINADDLRHAQLHAQKGQAAILQGNLDAAESHYRTARTTFAAFGRTDLAAKALSNLGNIHSARGDYGAAENFHEQALALATERVGEHHPTLGPMLEGIAYARRQQGSARGLDAMYGRALALYRDNLGPNSIKAAALQGKFGGWLREQRRIDEAIDRYRAGLEMMDANPDAEDDGVRMRLMGNLGSTLTEAERYDEAAIWQYRNVEALKELPLEQRSLAAALVNLSITEQSRGNGDKAAVLADRGLALARKVFDPDDPKLIRFSTTVAHQVLMAGDAERALRLLDDAATILQRTDNLSHGLWLMLRAEVLFALERGREARDHARQCASVFEALQGADSKTAARCHELASD